MAFWMAADSAAAIAPLLWMLTIEVFLILQKKMLLLLICILKKEKFVFIKNELTPRPRLPAGAQKLWRFAPPALHLDRPNGPTLDWSRSTSSRQPIVCWWTVCCSTVAVVYHGRRPPPRALTSHWSTWRYRGAGHECDGSAVDPCSPIHGPSHPDFDLDWRMSHCYSGPIGAVLAAPDEWLCHWRLQMKV